MDYTVILMKGATRENQHVEECGVYMRQQNYMLTFLMLPLHMFLYA